MFSKIAPYGKAIMGAVIGGLGAARLALSDDVITQAEGIDIATVVLTALLVVWAIPNKDPKGEHQDESVQPDDGLSYEEAGGQPYPDNDYGYVDRDASDNAAGDPNRP